MNMHLKRYSQEGSVELLNPMATLKEKMIEAEQQRDYQEVESLQRQFLARLRHLRQVAANN